MKAVNSYVEQTYYLLSGLGMATETSGIQRFLTYNGNQVGGGLQYNYAGRMNILLDLGYSKKVEDRLPLRLLRVISGRRKMDYGAVS